MITTQRLSTVDAYRMIVPRYSSTPLSGTKSNKDGMILGFTEQFDDWMRGTFFAETRRRLPVGIVPTKLETAERFFDDWKSTWAEYKRKALPTEALLSNTCPYLPEIDAAEAGANALEIIVSAVGLQE